MSSEICDQSHIEATALLFAYGTLVPRDPLERARLNWQPDAVRGRLYDLGPYPGLLDLNAEGAPWVEGFCRPVEHDELIHRLDPYEAVAEGLYRRERTPTREGRTVWVYVYNRPLPQAARGPIDSWHGPASGYRAPSLHQNASALEVTPGGES